MKLSLRLAGAFLAALSAFGLTARAQTTWTWLATPANGDWSATDGNWTPAAGRPGAGDTAIFGTSSITGLTVSGQTMDNLVFNSGASAYTFTSTSTATLGGAGILNNSGLNQSFAGSFTFTNTATAGAQTTFTATGASQVLTFSGSATAGSASLIAQGGTGGNPGGGIVFGDTSTGGTASVKLLNQGTLLVASSASAFSLGSLEGAGTATFNRTVTLGGNGASTTFSGLLQGAGGLTKVGSGTLTLSGTNTYAGGTTINAGLVKFSSLDNFGTGNLTLDGGGVQWTTGNQADISSRLTAIGAGGATFAIISGNFVTLASSLTGEGGLTKTGPGVLLLTAQNTYTGTTTILQGIVWLDSTGTSAPGTLGSGVTTIADEASAGLIFSGQTSAGSGTFIVNGLGAIEIEENATAGNGTFTLNGGGLAIYGDGNATAGNATITLNGGTASSAHGGSIAFDGNGHAGNATIIVNGGTNGGLGGNIYYVSDSGATHDDTSTVKIYGNGALNLMIVNPASVTIGSLEGTGMVFLGNSNLIVGNNHQDTVFSGVIQNGTKFNIVNIIGPGTLTKIGTGTLTLSGTNTYSGGTTVSSGTLTAGSTAAFGTGTVHVNGGTLNLGDFAVTNALDVHGGALTGLANYAGTQTLSATASYTGPVGGSMVVASGGVLTTSGASFTGTTTVQSGGRIGGTGSVGSLALLSGSTLAPGTSPGTLFVTGSATWAGGANYQWEIRNATAGAGTGYDLLAISGTLTLTATGGNPFALSLVSLLANNSPGNALNFRSAVNSSYTIASASGGIVGFNANAFAIDAHGFTNNLNGGAWTVSQDGNNLNLNFTASAIPEPSTYAALLGALALGLSVYRKRSRAG